ncbi:MAG: hypothetical protein PHW73_01265 [Atribacterota bacterium]|nr:hypothetical protein [Atribacterota bacterium]
MIDGIDLGTSSRRKKSKFFNKGKWNNFIKPLLPEDCSDMTFMELGCNAGLFLRLAKEKGFRNVIGIEKNHTECEVAKEYRDSLGLDYKVINKTINQDFDFKSFPVADFILMANFHYHLLLDDFIYLVERLASKTCYCLIVSVDIEQPHWKPKGDIESLRSYFKYWKEVKHIGPINTKGDPRPRNLFGILFKSDLERRPMKTLYSSNSKKIKRSPSLERLAKDIVRGRDITDIKKHPYFERTKWSRKHKWNEQQMYEFVQEKIDLFKDIRDNGLRRAVMIEEPGRMLEGNHRLVILRHLGYKSVIVRVIGE